MKNIYTRLFAVLLLFGLSMTVSSQVGDSYAVLIDISKENRFARETIAMYCTLKEEYGYTDENIFIHLYDGQTNCGCGSIADINDKVDYPAYETYIKRTFKNLSGEWTDDSTVPALTSNDNLFIFMTGHGSTDDGDGYIHNTEDGDNRIYDYEFAGYLSSINCNQIITVMQNCYSGNFISEYLDYSSSCTNRIIQTSTGRWDYSIAENHITSRYYNEFLYYWIAAVRGYYPNEENIWSKGYQTGSFPFDEYFDDHPSDYNPDVNGDGIVQMSEAFDYADNFDTWSPSGYYNPYSSIGNDYEPQSEVVVESSGVTFDLHNIIVPFSVEGTNVGQSDDWDVSGSDGSDISYKFYMPYDGYVSVSSCFPETNFDTKLEVFTHDGESSGLYIDDGAECSFHEYASTRYNFWLSEGIYYLVVDGYNGDEGYFKAEVSFGSMNTDVTTMSLNIANEDIDEVIVKDESVDDLCDFEVYPIPADNNFHVYISNNDCAIITLYDMNGKIVLEQSTNEMLESIDCSSIESGLYCIVVYALDKVYSKKIQILR